MKKIIPLLILLFATSLIYAQIFVKAMDTTFEGVLRGSVAFSDIDRDGDEDVLITGDDINFDPISKLYENDGFGVFTEVQDTPFEEVRFSSIAFSDVDGDGDEDVLITGADINSEPISKLYINDGLGAFSEAQDTAFEGADFSSIAFADVDGDGDEDVLITGKNDRFSTTLISRLYKNEGFGVFTEALNTSFEGVWQSSIAFSDVDGDGDEDVVITGDGDGRPIAKLYLNDGDGVFSEEQGNPSFESVGVSSLAFSDVDGDGDEDVLITGRKNAGSTSNLYINNLSTEDREGDECEDAIDIQSLLGSQAGEVNTSGVYDNTGYNSSPLPGVCLAIQNSIWFSFTGNGGSYNFTSVQCGVDLNEYIDDSQVHIYSGDCNNLVWEDCNDDGETFAFDLDFDTEDGEQYYLIVAGFDFTYEGKFCLQVTETSTSSEENILQNINIYPNPALDFIMIEGFEGDRLELIDLTGKVIRSWTGHQQQLQLQGLPSGSYFLRMYDDDNSFLRKIVKL